MKRTIRSLIAFALILTVLLTVCGCTNEKRELQALITEFESACNVLDFDRVLACLQPKTADAIKVASGVLGFFTNADTDTMCEALASALSLVNLGGTDSFRSLQIEVKEIRTEETKAQMDTVFTYDFQGKSVSKNVTVKCVYEFENWYISEVQFEK